MRRYYYSFLLLSSTLAGAQEPSVFGAGNLDSKNPYGLNSSEKHILKNQQDINQLSSKVGDLNSLIDTINRRLEGMESTYEGDSAKLNSTVVKVNELVQKVESSSNLVSKNTNDNAEIRNVSEQLLNMKEESDKEIKKNLATLKTAVQKVTDLVNKINSEYVSSSELQKNMDQFVTREEFEALKKNLGAKTSTVKPSVDTTKKAEAVNTTAATVADTTATAAASSNSSETTELNTAAQKADYLTKAKEEFDRKYYTGAMPKFEKLVEINYKPAEANYYLGEMWYVRKNYSQAIAYFKKSAMLSDKASYMPTLLLHSAISFEKTGDKENAKSFYATLLDLYPKSSDAQTAKENLSKL